MFAACGLAFARRRANAKRQAAEQSFKVIFLKDIAPFHHLGLLWQDSHGAVAPQFPVEYTHGGLVRSWICRRGVIFFQQNAPGSVSICGKQA